MLRSPWATYEHRSFGVRHAARRTYRERVSFGGVAFELLCDRPLRHDLEGSEQRFWQVGADPRAIADVVCAIRVDPGHPFDARDNAIQLHRDAETGTTHVRARSLEAELSKVGARRYAAAAQLADEPEALIGLLRALAGAVVHREGGLMLHTAAVELDGRAVLFVGPSGAGKSTAARQTDGARCFAFDHVALVPADGVPWAWGLPGGTPSRAPLADDVAFPVAAVLRVRKASEYAAPRVQWLTGVEALFAVRESIECADHSPGAEDVYLHAVTKLSRQLAVGVIHTVLERPHGELLRMALRELAARAEARRS